MQFPSAVFTLNLSAQEVGLFGYLYLIKNRENKVCITYSLLSHRLSIPRASISKALKTLERKGLLSITKRYFRYKDTFSHRNCYHLISPLRSDPELPLREIYNLPLSLQEKALLLYITYLSGEEGDTFSSKNEILTRFNPKPRKAFMSLVDKGYIEMSRTGVKLLTF